MAIATFIHFSLIMVCTIQTIVQCNVEQHLLILNVMPTCCALYFIHFNTCTLLLLSPDHLNTMKVIIAFCKSTCIWKIQLLDPDQKVHHDDLDNSKKLGEKVVKKLKSGDGNKNISKQTFPELQYSLIHD